MGSLAHLALLCGALFVVIGATSTVLLGLLRGRRRPYGVIAVVVGSLSLAVLAVEETAPRLAADRDLKVACLNAAVHTSLSRSPVTWQMLTGGLEVDAQVGADQVTRLVTERLSALPLQDTTVELGQDEVEVDATIATALGDIPMIATVTPQTTQGDLRFEPTSLEIAGRALPVTALSAFGVVVGEEPSACGGRGIGQLSGARLTGASVNHDGLALRLRM